MREVDYYCLKYSPKHFPTLGQTYLSEFCHKEIDIVSQSGEHLIICTCRVMIVSTFYLFEKIDPYRSISRILNVTF